MKKIIYIGALALTAALILTVLTIFTKPSEEAASSAETEASLSEADENGGADKSEDDMSLTNRGKPLSVDDLTAKFRSVNSDGEVILFKGGDYDGSGTNEGYGVVRMDGGVYDLYYIEEHGLVYFIKSFSDYDPNSAGTIAVGEQTIFRFDRGNGGVTDIFSVKGGIPYELGLSGQVHGLTYSGGRFVSEEGVYALDEETDELREIR